MNPLELPNLAAWYDLALPASTTSNDIRIDASNRVSLIADKSGNSATNCLCLNGASGNYASTPDAAVLDLVGDLEMRFDCRINTLGRVECFGAKRSASAAANSSFWLQKSLTGLLQFYYSNGTSFFQFDSTATLGSAGLSALQRVQLRVAVDKDNGAGGTTVQFFYRTDGTITGTTGWTQLGADVTVAGTTAINNSTSGYEVGAQQAGTVDPFAGVIYRAQIYNGIAGTLVFDANFSTASKLATSFTESSSNAATVTINSSGDLGARISGERDLVQLTASKQPIYLPFSGTNYGWLNGVSGNGFSTPDGAALDVTGDIDIRVFAAPDSWTPASRQALIAKWVNTGNQRAYFLSLEATTGILKFWISTTGSDFPSADSTAATGFAARSANWVRVTRVQSSGVVTFFTSSDGTTWTQLGNTVVLSAGNAIFNSTAIMEVGSDNTGNDRFTGSIFRAQVLNGIGGTVVADFNPSLYTSGTTFTASTGEVWTLNGGATIVNRTSVYFDGSNDYMKAAAFSLSQPETVYFTGQQVSFSAGDAIFDGNGAAERMQLGQDAVSPSVNLFAGASGPSSSLWAIGTDAVLSSVFNGIASGLRFNRNSATTGAAGFTPGNGFTLGAFSGASFNSNIRANEVCIYSAAHDTSAQDRVIQYAGRKWGISGV